MKNQQEIKQEEIDPEHDDDIDELFSWMATTYKSGGSGNLNDYSCILQNGTITSIFDGETTVSLT